VRETSLRTDDLVMTVFVHADRDEPHEIPSMPGIYQYPIEEVDREIDRLLERGVSSILLFGIPEDKDDVGSDTWSDDGVIQQTLRRLNRQYGDELLTITDVCFCEYTTHGHCGVIDDDGRMLNDPTLHNLQKQVVSHARAGADIVAPSGMVDGMVGAIRSALDDASFEDVGILSYSVKYASCFYGPFRDAVATSSEFDHRRRYQMEPSNSREANIEAELDVDQGADALMVKPALPYLDIIRRIDEQYDLPLACYNVSGEYAMIRAAGERGWLDAEATALEALTCMKRAGADIVISYFARTAAESLD
jgi:porphobilinogen synthase